MGRNVQCTSDLCVYFVLYIRNPYHHFILYAVLHSVAITCICLMHKICMVIHHMYVLLVRMGGGGGLGQKHVIIGTDWGHMMGGGIG